MISKLIFPFVDEIVFMQNKIFKAKPGLQQTNNKEEKRQCRGSFNQDRQNAWSCGVFFYLICADLTRLGNSILIRATVCWIEVKVAVLCAHQYMAWNLLLINTHKTANLTPIQQTMPPTHPYIYYVKNTLLGFGSEWPKDQSLPLKMVSYLKK